MKCFWSCFMSGGKYQEQISMFLLPQHGNKTTSHVFHFSNFGLQKCSKMLKQILVVLFGRARKDHQTNVSRFIEIIDKVIRPDQTTYIPGRFIGESIRLISDILEYTEAEQMEGYMSAADIEKAFYSFDHNFLIAVLKNFGLGHEFIQWVKTLLYDQQSCVMNNGHSTGYLALKRGFRQGDPL